MTAVRAVQRESQVVTGVRCAKCENDEVGFGVVPARPKLAGIESDSFALADGNGIAFSVSTADRRIRLECRFSLDDDDTYSWSM
ncbi:hypothetical protein [Haladaptatus sp. CMAA 1911]|uniref:hypothetical protein n=1 Tax=unclassified Haladaptatus TaxID=2622732 RepID=UPI003754317E